MCNCNHIHQLNWLVWCKSSREWWFLTGITWASKRSCLLGHERRIINATSWLHSVKHAVYGKVLLSYLIATDLLIRLWAYLKSPRKLFLFISILVKGSDAHLRGLCRDCIFATNDCSCWLAIISLWPNCTGSTISFSCFDIMWHASLKQKKKPPIGILEAGSNAGRFQKENPL